MSRPLANRPGPVEVRVSLGFAGLFVLVALAADSHVLRWTAVAGVGTMLADAFARTPHARSVVAVLGLLFAAWSAVAFFLI